MPRSSRPERKHPNLGVYSKLTGLSSSPGGAVVNSQGRETLESPGTANLTSPNGAAVTAATAAPLGLTEGRWNLGSYQGLTPTGYSLPPRRG